MSNICAKRIGRAMLNYLGAIDELQRELAASGARVDLSPLLRAYDKVRQDIDQAISQPQPVERKEEAE